MNTLPLLICGYYLTLTIAVILFRLSDKLRTSFLTYGKIRRDSDIMNLATGLTRQIGLITVPKRRFRDFYFIGLVWNGYLLWEISRWQQGYSLGPVYSYLIHWSDYGTACLEECLLIAVLLQVQFARRYYECLVVERPSHSAVIHVGHYVIGITYYLITSLLPWAYAAKVLTQGKTQLNPNQLKLNHLGGICLFLYASLHQHRCHQILAKLRRSDRSADYSIPYGDWFKYVSSPHYLAELLIYIGLATIAGFSSVWYCLLLWILVGLGVTASNTHKWYRHHFHDTYPIDRCAFLPLIW